MCVCVWVWVPVVQVDLSSPDIVINVDCAKVTHTRTACACFFWHH